ncbi:expansin EXLX1 family cellulose-binding protein [Sphaerisporangium sp. NPDC051011]|uniref:expansin EXLX1 family cellulose-binding protein n=1 Tax=Sphaerisporangium sp. NPDC051011 TaxID=3155792 RepID=UPI0033F20E81
MNADRRQIRRPSARRTRPGSRPGFRLGRRPDDDAGGPPAVVRRLAWAVSATAALALVALGAQTGRNAACAASLAGPAGGGGAAASGRTGGGECSLRGAVRDDLVVAVSAEEYAGASACGAYLDVTGPRGIVRVQVVGECLGCAPGEVDLSRPAFTRIAYPGRRVVPVGYHTVRNPAMTLPVAFRVRPGSSAGRLAIQAVDHGNPLLRLEVLTDGRWRRLSRDSGNYWVAEDGAGPGPFVVRITDVYGQRLTASGIRLDEPGLQRTTRRLYAPAQASPAPPARTATGREVPGPAPVPDPDAPGPSGRPAGSSGPTATPPAPSAPSRPSGPHVAPAGPSGRPPSTVTPGGVRDGEPARPPSPAARPSPRAGSAGTGSAGMSTPGTGSARAPEARARTNGGPSRPRSPDERGSGRWSGDGNARGWGYGGAWQESSGSGDVPGDRAGSRGDTPGLSGPAPLAALPSTAPFFC